MNGIAAYGLPPALILSPTARVMSVSQPNPWCNIYGSIPRPVLDAPLDILMSRSLRGRSLESLKGKACYMLKEVISPQR